MIAGVVTTKEVLSHPVLLIQELGFLGYLGLLIKGASFHKYHFVDLLFRVKG